MKNDLFKFDKTFQKDYPYLIGTDEAGRGPGAGDVVAAAVYFPNYDKTLKKQLLELDDSKKLTDKQKSKLFEIIIQNAVYDIEFGSVEEIERTNILKTSLNCMNKACTKVIKQINKEDVFVIVDGNKLIPNFDYPQKYIVKGDGKSACIAAASVLAKVTRDKYMDKLDKEFPEYKWSKNKGYLTPEHLEAVDKYGLTKYHRKKFFDKHFAKQLSLF